MNPRMMKLRASEAGNLSEKSSPWTAAVESAKTRFHGSSFFKFCINVELSTWLLGMEMVKELMLFFFFFFADYYEFAWKLTCNIDGVIYNYFVKATWNCLECVWIFYFLFFNLGKLGTIFCYFSVKLFTCVTQKRKKVNLIPAPRCTTYVCCMFTCQHPWFL